MSKVAFHTLGCKVNQYDTQAMLERFQEAGYEVVPFDGLADVYVINTCTVTGTGDKKSMQAIRRCARKNPEAHIVVTGCLAQRAAQTLRLPGVRLILGTQRRGEVVELLREAEESGETLIAVEGLRRAPFEALTVHAHEGHTRATMKIQEGCDRYCAYCIIPYVRGPIRSRPLEEIRREADELCAAGFRELVLTGIHLTSYGRDLKDGATLSDAIRAAHDAQGALRIRLGSLEPVIVTEEFVRALRAMPKVCPQFHLALQSGSDAVLARMRRRYTSGEYLAACRMLREAFPGCALTTDVMTGFPGETEQEFEETMATVRAAGFSRIHVFPYSEREGTPAAAMEGSVPRHVREERARRLIALGKELSQNYLLEQVGARKRVLFEERDAQGMLTGYTDTYVHVRASGIACPGDVRDVIVESAAEDGLIARIAEE
ncbi:tRNA (N(6)-L-threonylcarbamoyladenosine(37)-C(2))-methylthiotransferase MtaB [Beduinella massiliensis]|uniref:tRNA (N(6)-L-threonylcarbamoyladenosine(37)-C(2))- methylthiotransferase MtaB n=1 Tax=Beduinella massiliensis TaxID=1852363 RepID=UPI000C83B149